MVDSILTYLTLMGTLGVTVGGILAFYGVDSSGDGFWSLWGRNILIFLVLPLWLVWWAFLRRSDSTG